MVESNISEIGHPCGWASCATTCSSDQALYEHLVQDHSAPWEDMGHRQLACQWAGCHTAPVKRWLPRHLISHTNHRPFVCPASQSQGCTTTFKTSYALDKHLKSFDSHRESEEETGPIVIKIRVPASRTTTAVTPKSREASTLDYPPALLEHLKTTHVESGDERCLWAKCTRSSPRLKQHFISHLPISYKPVECQLPGCGKTFRTITHMRSHVYAIHPDVFVARTSPDTKKRKRKGYVEKEDVAKRLRVDSDSDDSDDEPLAKQHRYRALPATKPADDKIAYVDDIKNTNGHTDDTKPDYALEDEDTIIDEDEDEDDTDWVRASSTAIATPEKEQTPSTSIALQDCVNSNPGTAVDERLVAVELRIKNLETQLADALSVIRQSEVLRAEWESRKNILGLEDAGILETAIDLDQDPRAPMQMGEVLDDWSMWVTDLAAVMHTFRMSCTS
ncbi:hypothetical protein EXIGLDRAFT_815754 [Exidia glandulosa HHB12029]|uniref:C2H2-type domain-containing protein n=1 Tax=Exidia glandulosa HHB12029 TaxID=1314781 RepID=A0A165KRE9_EXIGL|nr:hypothetical protein EXIGLDRAFT_815754 [Exidia glandulosa HHB12029]